MARSIARLVLLPVWGLFVASGIGQTAILPEFEVATIKPIDPNGRLNVSGFLGYPGGKVYLGGTAKMMVMFAFDIGDSKISGGPPWAGTDKYALTALPAGYSEQVGTTAKFTSTKPTAEQRQMLQGLLEERFGLKFHREMKEEAVYFLERGDGPLAMHTPKDTNLDPRGGIVNRSGIVNGEAFGQNVSMAVFAESLSRSLGKDVLDRTGLTGSYDFHLDGTDPENREMEVAVFDVVKRLGLKLRAGKAPVETIVIDSVTRPTAN